MRLPDKGNHNRCTGKRDINSQTIINHNTLFNKSSNIFMENRRKAVFKYSL